MKKINFTFKLSFLYFFVLGAALGCCSSGAQETTQCLRSKEVSHMQSKVWSQTIFPCPYWLIWNKLFTSNTISGPTTLLFVGYLMVLGVCCCHYVHTIIWSLSWSRIGSMQGKCLNPCRSSLVLYYFIFFID